MKKRYYLICILVVIVLALTACDEYSGAGGSAADMATTQEIADRIQGNQPTPSDIDYSLERYNLIRRAYWVNGQREKAAAVPCPVQKPLGYVVLFTESGAAVQKFVVDGKVSSLNSFLTPDSEYYELAVGGNYTCYNDWLADVDGSYGENDNGIFFFTPDGKYIEWTGIYLYSDIPFEIADPVLTYAEAE